MSVPLSTLYAQALASASKTHNLPTIDDSTQDLIQSCLRDLKTLQSRIIGLSLFSPNESLEDISTMDLLYLTVPYVCAQVQGRVKTTDRDERMVSLDQTQRYINQFVLYLENYTIVPEDERKLYERKSSTVTNPASRRELKINQYKKEKDLRTRIQVIRKRRGQLPAAEDPSSDFDLILSVLPSSKSTSEDDEEDSHTDEVLREAVLLLLRLFFVQAQSQLESMEQELELLKSAPPPSPPQPKLDEDIRRGKQKESDADLWKLDTPTTGVTGGNGPLLDATGKPLRPFTILPAGAADRARLQAQVFGPDHNLPTMSIDEYLEIERQRGKFISGGGPASESAPTSSEQLALDAERDGTLDGEEKEEQKRLKDENWARFTDENPRGAGNTMNRG